MKCLVLIFVISMVLPELVQAAPSVEEGRSIFTARCAACHNVNQQLTGPALAGVEQRHTLDWIVNFVHASQSVIKSGDSQAAVLYKQYNGIVMPNHEDLTRGQIESILAYIKSEEHPADAAKAPFARPEKVHPNYRPLSSSNWGFFLIYSLIVLLLVGALISLVRTKEYARARKNERQV